jgi:hypothetical protein
LQSKNQFFRHFGTFNVFTNSEGAGDPETTALSIAVRIAYSASGVGLAPPGYDLRDVRRRDLQLIARRSGVLNEHLGKTVGA